MANAFNPEPARRWRQENGAHKTIVTGQLRLRSHAGVLDLGTEFGGGIRAEVACRKLKYFEEFKELLDSLAEKAAELLLSYAGSATAARMPMKAITRNTTRMMVTAPPPPPLAVRNPR